MTYKLEARIQSSVFDLFVDIKTITLLCSVKACGLCQNSIIYLHLAVFCSHFFYLTFSLTKTNIKKKKQGEKIIFFQLGYFIHLCSGFSGFPTDVNPSPCTLDSSRAKGKTGKVKMKLQNQANFNSFQYQSFKKNIQLVDSVYTPGEREQKCIWNENHSSWEARKGSGAFPPSLFSLCGFGGHLL